MIHSTEANQHFCAGHMLTKDSSQCKLNEPLDDQKKLLISKRV